MIGRDGFREKTQRRVAIAAAEVAEDLIERAVFLHDVDHVFDGRRVADFPRNGISFELRGFDLLRGRRHAGIRDGTPFFHLLLHVGFLGWKRDDAHSALHDARDVLRDAGWRRLCAGLRIVAVRAGDDALAVCDEQLSALRHADARGIPARRDEAERAGFSCLLHFKDGDGIDVRVCNEKPLAIGRKRERVRRVAGRRICEEFGDERLHDAAGIEVDDADGISVRVCDEELLPAFGHQHFVRMLLHLPACDLGPRGDIDNGDVLLRPEAHVKAVARFIEHARVRERRILARGVEDLLGAFGDAWVVCFLAGFFRRFFHRCCEDEIGDVRRAHRAVFAGIDADAAHALAPDVGDVDCGAILRNREPAGDASLLLRAKPDACRLGKVAAFEIEHPQHLLAGAADDQFFPVGRKRAAVKRLGNIRGADDFIRRDVENADLVLTISAVKDRGILAVGVQRDVHGEIAHLNLLPDRVERPLVWQKNRAVLLSAGQDGRGLILREQWKRAERENDG